MKRNMNQENYIANLSRHNLINKVKNRKKHSERVTY